MTLMTKLKVHNSDMKILNPTLHQGDNGVSIFGDGIKTKTFLTLEFEIQIDRWVNF